MAKTITTVLNELSRSYIPHIKSRYTIDFDFVGANSDMSGVIMFKNFFKDIHAISLQLPGYDANFEPITAGRDLNRLVGLRPSDINPFQGFKFTFINDKHMILRRAFVEWYYAVKNFASQPLKSIDVNYFAHATIKIYDQANVQSATFRAKLLIIDMIEPGDLAWSSQEEYSTTTIKLQNAGDMKFI